MSMSDAIYEESEAMAEDLTIEERYAAIDAAREAYYAYEARATTIMAELHEIVTEGLDDAA